MGVVQEILIFDVCVLNDVDAAVEKPEFLRGPNWRAAIKIIDA